MGFWPAPPGRRMPWDRDGSALIHITNAAVITTHSEADRRVANNETNPGITGFVNNGAKKAIVFAIPQTVVGVYASQVNGVSALQWLWEYSLDTTTGNDGAWTLLRPVGNWAQEIDVPATYRLTQAESVSGIYSASPMPVADVKGVRIRCTGVTGSPSVGSMHVYGYPTSPSNRLMLWHPTLDQGLAATPSIYDLGDIPRGSGPQIFSFRVKNISPTLTAQTVTVLREALTDGTPTIISLTDIRYDGGSYGTTATVGNLGPGAISQQVDVRVDITSLAPVGPWAPRVIAAATSWV